MEFELRERCVEYVLRYCNLANPTTVTNYADALYKYIIEGKVSNA